MIEDDSTNYDAHARRAFIAKLRRDRPDCFPGVAAPPREASGPIPDYRGKPVTLSTEAQRRIIGDAA